MQLRPISRLRALAHRWHALVRGEYWFPHVPLAIMLAIGGVWLLRVDFGQYWTGAIVALMHGRFDLQPGLLPPLLIGGGMLTMAIGLLLRSRLAWTMAVLLALTASASLLLESQIDSNLLLPYFALVLAALFFSWRQFDRSSVAASTLFALTSVAMLLMYATFGAFYLGKDFDPPITDLITALYYSMVTMSTVGYGDITPQTPEAKMFTVSVIILGVAVFATSLTAVIAPMVSRSLKRIVSRGGKRMKRENHYVVIGNGSLAINTARELSRRGLPVTRIVREALSDDPDGRGGDLISGEPSNIEVLREAGADKAEAVLAMLVDDSENAFVVLAVKELGGSARTIAAVNDADHLSRIKLVQPDIVIAPQVLGGELLAMLLSGEEISADFVLKRVFQEKAVAGDASSNHNPDPG